MMMPRGAPVYLLYAHLSGALLLFWTGRAFTFPISTNIYVCSWLPERNHCSTNRFMNIFYSRQSVVPSCMGQTLDGDFATAFRSRAAAHPLHTDAIKVICECVCAPGFPVMLTLLLIQSQRMDGAVAASLAQIYALKRFVFVSTHTLETTFFHRSEYNISKQIPTYQQPSKTGEQHANAGPAEAVCPGGLWQLQINTRIHTHTPTNQRTQKKIKTVQLFRTTKAIMHGHAPEFERAYII